VGHSPLGRGASQHAMRGLPLHFCKPLEVIAMEKRAKVFIAGSRRLSRLSADVLQQIDNVLDQGCTVLVGDASGVDKAVQEYLNARQYGEVVVFCAGGKWRRNAGHWPVKSIGDGDLPQRDFAYFYAKDRVMARDCDYGLMIWNGRSPGTLANILDLVKEAKPAIVYVARNKRFFTLWSPEDLSSMLEVVAPDLLLAVEGEWSALAVA